MKHLIDKIEDKETQELFELGYKLVKKNPSLRKLSSEKRMMWIQGFVNGVTYGSSIGESKKTE